MFINSIIKQTKVNGPGTRYTIWFQGCSIRCPGCGNKHTWEPGIGEIWTPEQLLKDVKANSSLLGWYPPHGISLTGGEPLDQYEEVLDFLKLAFPLYNIFLTSGYTYEVIQKRFPEILKYIDILVDGPFIEELLDETTAWRGSTNQTIRFLTDNAKKYENYKSEYGAEVIIMNDKITMTGFGIPKSIEQGLML